MELTQNQQRLWQVFKFLLLFNLLAIPLHLIMYYNVNLYPLAYVERAQVAFFLDLFGVNYGLSDVPISDYYLPAIEVNSNVMAIGEACTAVRSLFAFIALVIASPRSWVDKKKAWIFLPFIYIINVLRITSLAFVSLTIPELFEMFHIYFWREGLIAIILFSWIYWFTQLSESRPVMSLSKQLQ